MAPEIQHHDFAAIVTQFEGDPVEIFPFDLWRHLSDAKARQFVFKRTGFSRIPARIELTDPFHQLTQFLIGCFGTLGEDIFGLRFWKFGNELRVVI